MQKPGFKYFGVLEETVDAERCAALMDFFFLWQAEVGALDWAFIRQAA